MAAKTGVIVKKEFNELKRIKEKYTEEQKDFIRRTLAPTLNDNELLLFLYRAKKLKLNPLQGEITAHAREGKHGRQLVVVIGKDGKARKAMQTGLVEYARSEAIYTKATMTGDPSKDKEPGEKVVRCEPWEGGELWGAKAVVKRKGIRKAFVVVVPFEEYKGGLLYTEKPNTMIKKTALSQCYTLAFPDLFAGVYIEGEVPLPSHQKPLAIEGGEKPATEQQIATIVSLDKENLIQVDKDGRLLKPLTKQQAADLIRKLSQKKGKR